MRASAVPWVLALIHAAWLTIAIVNKPFQPYPGPRRGDELSFSSWHMATGMMIAGRDFHHDAIAWPLLIIDLPALALVTLLVMPFDASMSPMTASYVVAGGWLTLGSAWWFLIGSFVVRMLRRSGKR